jgi:hypothetical protein
VELKLKDLITHRDALAVLAAIKLGGDRALKRRRIISTADVALKEFGDEEQKAFEDIGGKASYEPKDGANYAAALNWIAEAGQNTVTLPIEPGLFVFADFAELTDSELNGLIALGIIEDPDKAAIEPTK